jgi:hypothetical protein
LLANSRVATLSTNIKQMFAETLNSSKHRQSTATNVHQSEWVLQTCQSSIRKSRQVYAIQPQQMPRRWSSPVPKLTLVARLHSKQVCCNCIGHPDRYPDAKAATFSSLTVQPHPFFRSDAQRIWDMGPVVWQPISMAQHPSQQHMAFRRCSREAIGPGSNTKPHPEFGCRQPPAAKQNGASFGT